tara:strand:+ start:8615 stop:15619 length:7005 start_codon:yes stop_codon:yes gene_type:complete
MSDQITPEMLNSSKQLKDDYNLKQAYEVGYQQAPQEPPQTFVIECNKVLAQADGDALKPNKWTNNFPSIKLKKGDIISVNSAFLSNRGSGDLLQFDETNNKTRVLFEYYGINDNANNKKPAYNINGCEVDTTRGYIYQAKGDGNTPEEAQPTIFNNCYPANYKPTRLYRLMTTYQLPEDTIYNGARPIVPWISQTGPNQIEPYKTPDIENFWGFASASQILIAKEEDKYVEGLIRAPKFSSREFQVWGDDSADPTGKLDPTAEPFFGINLGSLCFWYISTQLSKYGACSSNGSMRIYFTYGTMTDARDPNDSTQNAVQNTLDFLSRLRVGMWLKFENTDALCGLKSPRYEFKKADGTYSERHGSNAFYCSGYANKGEGFTTAGGDVVDYFEQTGNMPLGSNVKENNLSFFNVLGQFFKVVRVNIGATSTANKLGVFPAYTTANEKDWELIPFIEVQAKYAGSYAFGNPNMANPLGVPWLGANPSNGRPNIAEFSHFTSPFSSLLCRTWYMGAKALVVNDKGSVDGSADNGVNRREQGTKYNVDSFPKDLKTNGKLDEDMYVVSRPYFYSPRNVVGKDIKYSNANTSYFMTLQEENLDVINSYRDYDRLLGANARDAGDNMVYDADASPLQVGTIPATNYNWDTLNINTDPSSAVHSQYDYVNSNWESTYAGGRMPNYYNQEGHYTSDTYQKVQRIGVHNQGQDYRNTSRNPTQHDADANGFDNIANLGGYTSPNNGTECLCSQYLSVSQQGYAPDTDLYIKNHKGSGVHFYFTHTILKTANAYDGSPLYGPVWDGTAGNRPAGHTGGSINYIIGANNLPTSYFNAVLEVQDPSGLFYGFNNFQKTQAKVLRQSTNTDVLDAGVQDFCLVMSQFPSTFYARFRNSAGETEVMLIQVISAYVDTFTGTHDPAKLETPDAVQPKYVLNIYTDDAGNVSNARAPIFLILQRDCENTGKKTFNGAENGNPFPTGSSVFTNNHPTNYYNPQIVNEINTDLIKNKGMYFEILNGFGNIEHQFDLEDFTRELLPMSFDKSNDPENSRYFYNNFGNIGDGSQRAGQRYGKPCGSDFYMVKLPNMPYKDGDGVRHITDYSIRLTKELFKSGSPTRQSVITDHAFVSDQGRLQWDIHYDYIDLDLSGDKNYYSPNDISNLITAQLHKSIDLYKSYDTTTGGGGRFNGGQWANSAGKYPLNSTFRVIHGPQGEWDKQSGQLQGDFVEGEFCFILDMPQDILTNGINSYGYLGGNLIGYDNGWNFPEQRGEGLRPQGGRYTLFPQNNNYYMNTLPTTNSYTSVGWYYSDPVGTQNIQIHTDYNYSTATPAQQSSHYDKNETFGSMYVGTNNAQLNFNSEVSRFEWKFLHQPLYSEYKADENGNATGGNIIAKIWTQNIVGTDNWDRYGGINIVNWACPIQSFGFTTRRRDYKPYYKPNYTLLDTSTSDVGLEFMNKLGFTNQWLNDNSGSEDDPECSGMDFTSVYKPKGTTRSDYDVSQARPYTQTAPALSVQGGGDRPDFQPFAFVDLTANTGTDHNPNPSETDKASYRWSALQQQQVDNRKSLIQGSPAGSFNGAKPMGTKTIPDWAGTESQSNGGVAGNTKSYWRSGTLLEINQTLGYGIVGAYSQPPSVIYGSTKQNYEGDADMPGSGVSSSQQSAIPISLNLDDIKYPSYDIEVDSQGLTADELPKKTKIGYFLIMSDLIDKHEFMGSANDGSPLKCIGILSKNYENNDFYFSFQSPVEFYVKQDRTITSIKTEIVAPDLSDPIGLDLNSSIIYTIQRPETIPEPDVPPISVQQNLDYDIMEKLAGTLGKSNAFAGETGLGYGNAVNNANGLGLNTLRQNLVSAVLTPSPNQSTIIANTMGAMGGALSRMSIAQRGRVLGTQQTPAGTIATPNVEQLQIEGLGPAQPIGLPTEEGGASYLSAEQLQIQEFNTAGKKPEDPDAPLFPDDEEAPPAYGLGNSIDMPPEEQAEANSLMDTPKGTPSSPLFRSTSGSETGMSAPELFSLSASNTRKGATHTLQSVGMAEFFNKYMRVANEQTRANYRQQIDSGMDIDNPETWKKQMLDQWAGKGGDFNWGANMYGRIGATLNQESRTAILRQQEKFSNPDKERAGGEANMAIRADARKASIASGSKERNRELIPSAMFGQEDLRTRVSRDMKDDPRTTKHEKSNSIDQKDYGAHKEGVWWKGQNPYDVRTWTKGNVDLYLKDEYRSVPRKDHSPVNKLTEGAIGALRGELDRRQQGGTKLRMDEDKKYKENASLAKAGGKPEGYNHKEPHKTPHSSLGEYKPYRHTSTMNVSDGRQIRGVKYSHLSKAEGGGFHKTKQAPPTYDKTATSGGGGSAK